MPYWLGPDQQVCSRPEIGVGTLFNCLVGKGLQVQ